MRIFYINIPRSIQREVLTKEHKNRTTLIQKKKRSTQIKSLKAKPWQEDLLSALAEEEEEPRW